MKKLPYFTAFRDEVPPQNAPFSGASQVFWQFFAGATLGLGLWYLHWRWTASLNLDAPIFSILVVLSETLAFIGTALFFFDIWEEGDSVALPPPQRRNDLSLTGEGTISVDLFITTYDEDIEIVRPSILAAKAMQSPSGVVTRIYLLDDGNRRDMRQLAQTNEVVYISRNDNRGFKAGNLANALFQTDGDFIVICDADTQLFPTYLRNTLGYFRDPKVAWVQTPHWFYDLPKGRSWSDWLTSRLGRWSRFLAYPLEKLTGQSRLGADHFMSNPVFFFDVIQRRRNRNGASFCCGAGSIHRREAVFDNALKEQGAHLAKLMAGRENADGSALLQHTDLQPFRYHVSEDIFTSIQQHQKGWRSVYHPQIEARMLSPWSMSAWALQKLKYAGGTFDIMFHANPLFKTGMPWKIRLHYLATFWSYLAIFWLPILILAPAYSLFSGQAPISSYSIDFFRHILPVLICNELAMSLAAKGNQLSSGRVITIGTLFIQWRAMVQVLLGRKPHFAPTPKTPVFSASLRHALPNLILITILMLAVAYGTYRYLEPSGDYSAAFVLVNTLWICWVCVALVRVSLCALTVPEPPAHSPVSKSE